MALRMMKSFEGGAAGRPEKRLTARSNDPHHALTGVERPRYGSPELGQHQRGLRGCGQIGGDLLGVVVRVDIVLVEGHTPGHFLWSYVDVDPVGELTDGVESLAGDGAHRTIRSQRDATAALGTRLDGHLVIPQIECHHEGPGAVRRRQGGRLPPSRRQAQRRVLKLRLGRRERHRQLAQELRMRVQRVAGLRPALVGNPFPLRRHTRTLLNVGRALQGRLTGQARGAVLKRGAMEEPDVSASACRIGWPDATRTGAGRR